MNLENGSLLSGNNGQLFRIIGETQKKLWPGQPNLLDCIEAVGIVNGLPTVVHILKKDIKSYTNVTKELKMINDKYEELTDTENEELIEVETENRQLKIDIDLLRKNFEDLKLAFNVAQKSINEKNNIINTFGNNVANVDEDQDEDGVENIRKAVKNRGFNAFK